MLLRAGQTTTSPPAPWRNNRLQDDLSSLYNIIYILYIYYRITLRDEQIAAGTILETCFQRLCKAFHLIREHRLPRASASKSLR